MAVKSQHALPLHQRVKNAFSPAGIALACFSLCISVVMAFGQGTLWPSSASAQDAVNVATPDQTEIEITLDPNDSFIQKDTVCIASYKSITQNTDAASMANVAAAAEALNGLQIDPGEVLSIRQVFSGLANGKFQLAPTSAYSISGRVKGGGASQVASTLYMAALKAGMSVTERHAHVTVVDFALAGLDADVLSDGTDLKIENNLGRTVWVKAEADGQSVEVKLYATAGTDEKVYTPAPLSEVVDCVETKASELLPDPISVGILPDTVIRGYTVKTYLVTYEDGVERTRELVSKDIYAATADAPVSADKRS